MLKRNKGITLIALVLTIIILIILAGVSISLIVDQDGIIAKAQEAKESTRGSQIKEAVELASITNAVEENKVTKASIIEELKAKGQLTEEERQALVESDTITIGDIEIDFSILESNNAGGTQKQTLASQIKAANYGDKVNYSVTVNGVTLGNGTNGDLDWWKIFYKDETTNEVIMIYGDYLPNSTGIAASAGLTTLGTYGVYSIENKTDLINRLSDTENWSELLKGNVNLSSKGCTAKGAVDLETWVASWNAKEYTRLYTATNGSGEYYIGTSENPTSYYQIVSSDTSGHNNKLYFPHRVTVSDCYGYWLASPSAFLYDYVIEVSEYGKVGYDMYRFGMYNSNGSNYGVCPAVYLNSSILTSGKDASGNWIIE